MKNRIIATLVTLVLALLVNTYIAAHASDLPVQRERAHTKRISVPTSGHKSAIEDAIERLNTQYYRW